MKIKPYIFNGSEYHNLNDLADAYEESFDLAMDDIFNNAKKLIKFVKKVKKNKEFTNKIVNILYSSRYKNNALTFIIYEFSDSNKIVISGKELSLKEFITALKENPNTEDNTLFAFLEDSGLTKTYKKLDPESKLLRDSIYIEKNCYLPFTYKYLTTYDSFEIKESLNGKISSIAINGEECFRRGTKLTKNEDFQLGMAHKAGFKAAVEMNKDVNPIFKAVKLLKAINECEDEYLNKIISNTFYWWLIDNLDKYLVVNKKAKPVFLKLMELKKQYDKFNDLILAKKIYGISLELYSDLSRDLYLNYLEFVKMFREGKIIVKKRFDQNRYNFDKPYCNTYINQDFMDGKVIKLYTPHEDKSNEIEMKINPLTGEVIEEAEVLETNETDVDDLVDDVRDDAPIDVESDDTINDKKLIKLEKKINKVKRFAGIMTFISVLNIVLGIVFAGLSMLKDMKEESLATIGNNMNLLLSDGILVLILALAPVLLTLILGIVLMVRANKTLNKINDARFIQNARLKDDLSVKQERRLNSLALNEAQTKKRALKSHRLLTCIITVLVSVSYAAIGICACGIINAFMTDAFSFKDQINNISTILMAVGIAAGLSLLIGLIKKYKGIITALFISIVSIAAAIAVVMFL